MAQEIIAKSASKLNLYSRRHLQLYSKVLFTGSQMAYLLNHYDQQIGLSKAATDTAKEWFDLMERLGKLVF